MNYREIRSLPAMFYAQAERYGDQPFLWRKQSREWQPLTWKDVAERARALAAGLKGLGVGKGDRVTLVSENRPEWMIADLAIMTAGAITVPAYTTNTVNDHVHILSDSGSRCAIVSTAALADAVLPAAAMVSGVTHVIAIEPPAIAVPDGVSVLSWDSEQYAQRVNTKKNGLLPLLLPAPPARTSTTPLNTSCHSTLSVSRQRPPDGGRSPSAVSR